jgi:8-oxo-dGTP pyrophosphatase MutT (NUDIX family)
MVTPGMLRGMVRPFPDVETLRGALAGRPEPPVEGPGRPAAVLVCLQGGRVLLLQRALHENDPWSGHVSFPGGRHEPGDGSLLQTALRETCEEVGFDAAAVGDVLGPLGEYAGRGRGIRAIRIAAFVAWLPDEPPLRLSDEVASAHWIALDALVPGETVVSEVRGPMPAFLVDDGGVRLTVWGITHGILELLRQVD